MSLLCWIGGKLHGQVTHRVTNNYLGASMPSDTVIVTVFTTRGDPDNPFDDNLAIMDPLDTFWVLRFHDLSSFLGGNQTTTVQLQGASGGSGLVTYDVNLVGQNGDTQLYTRWLVFAPPTQLRPDFTVEPALVVEREVTLLGDAVEMRLRLKGNDNYARRISVGFVLDPGFNPIANPSQLTTGPFFVPNHAIITKETEFVVDLPPFWIYTPAPDISDLSLKGTIIPPEGPVPRRVVFALASNLTSALFGYGFDYRPDPFIGISALNADSAVGVYWDPVTIGPSVSREFVVVFGLNRGVGDYRRPYSLTALSVPSLTVQLGDDPFTPEVETAYVSPNPFPVTASVYNASSQPLSGVSLTLTLPTGFTFAPGEVPTKSVPTIAPNGERQVTWQVRVDPNLVTGRTELIVTATALVGGTRQVRVPLLVPALPVRAFSAGLHMVGFPFEFSNPEPAATLGLSPGEFLLAHYDPLRQRYLIYRQDVELNRLERGKGYWSRLFFNRTITLQGTLPVNLDEPVTVPIQQGWNQLSNPFPVPILLGGVQVFQGSSVNPIPLEQAVQQGLIRGALFVWRSDPGLPPFGGEYQAVPVSYGVLLMPWQGFWLYSAVDGGLIFSPLAFIGPLQTRLAPQGATFSVPSGGWRLNLWAESASGFDRTTWLGVRQQAAEGLDWLDVPKPPPVPGGLQVSSVVMSGRVSVPLSIDWRPPSARVVWNLEIANPAGGEVRLRFDGLTQVPRSVALTLVDPETGQQWSLRSVPSVTVITQPQQPKRLQLIAVQTNQLPLRVQGLRVVRLRGRGAYIEFAVTQPSQVKVRVCTLTGRMVWETMLAATPGSRQRVFWDGQSVGAQLLPNQMPYLVVVQAIGEDGRQTQAQVMVR